MLVGLTGGIGSGKSTAAELFARHGFAVIDSDAIARKEVETPEVLTKLAEAYGADILTGDPSSPLDRKLLASRAFVDDAATQRLNLITHPAIRARTQALLDQADPRHNPVLVDMPLLVETGFYASCDEVVVVVTDLEMRVNRLVQLRGLDEADARSRIASQTSDEEKRSVADFVIDNSGDLHHLEAQVEKVGGEIVSRYL